MRCHYRHYLPFHLLDRAFQLLKEKNRILLILKFPKSPHSYMLREHESYEKAPEASLQKASPRDDVLV